MLMQKQARSSDGISMMEPFISEQESLSLSGIF